MKQYFTKTGIELKSINGEKQDKPRCPRCKSINIEHILLEEFLGPNEYVACNSCTLIWDREKSNGTVSKR